MRFRATIELGGKTATGFEVPAHVVEQLGSGRRPAVTVTIGDHTYRSTVTVMGGRFLIPLSAENRAAAGVAAGDQVDVALELDSRPREVELPADFAAALEREPAAAEFFAGISYSDKRWHVLSVEGAKKEETRLRRIEKSVAMLRDGRAR
ncbi:YdeI/OmpD-associated family protein [Pseudonocardia sichuanensis]